MKPCPFQLQLSRGIVQPVEVFYLLKAIASYELSSHTRFPIVHILKFYRLALLILLTVFRKSTTTSSCKRSCNIVTEQLWRKVFYSKRLLYAVSAHSTFCDHSVRFSWQMVLLFRLLLVAKKREIVVVIIELLVLLACEVGSSVLAHTSTRHNYPLL